jgi:hypothetical protein
VRQRLPFVLSVTALVVAVLGSTGPAIAHGVQHALFAHNADKVDGKHAVGAGASVAARKGKLVATSGTSGYLPNNVIQKAPNADRLDGVDSSGFYRAGSKVVDANKLDGLDPSDLVHVVGGGNAEDPVELTAAYEPVLAVELTAPRAGFVLLTGTVSGIGLTPRAECQCAIFTRVRRASVPAGELELPYSVAYVSEDVTPVETTATTAVVPVQAGTQSFVLESKKWEVNGAGDVGAFAPALTALYVPYGSVEGEAAARNARARTLPAVVGGS